jgi:putative DNA primase/helicase
MYKKQGLKEPKAVKTAVENYEKSNDRVGMFVEERCELGANYRIKRGDLYNAYKSWCVANGLKYVNSPRFFEQISIWAEAVKNKGNFEWKGIKLRASTIQLDNSEVEK